MILLPNFKDLTLREQVAQMLVVRASGYLFDHQIQYPSWEPPAEILHTWLQDLGVGGVILLGGSAGELAWRCQQLQDHAKVPLFLAADIEEGVGQRFSGATWFAPPMALADLARRDVTAAQVYARQMGTWTAQEALAIGLNWVLAPVVDVNNNPQNPVINVRAFGENPMVVSQLATAFIQGAQKYAVLTTAKHFPGHGDTATDSHLDLPVIPHGLKRLKEIEYPPFEAAIAAGVDSIMSAHLLIPELDPTHPATLSARILTQELRQKLGFEGLVVTDALVMGAIADRYGANEAAVLAVEAGADILMMPADPPRAIEAICDAVTTGRLTAARIEASLQRIWEAKRKLNTVERDPSHHNHAWEHPPTSIRVDQLAQPNALATAATILRSTSRVKGQISASQPHQRTVIIVDDVIDLQALNRKAPAIDIPRQRNYQVQILDCHTPELAMPTQPSPLQPTLLQLFIRGNPFRGSAELSQLAQNWFDYLCRTQQLQGLVIYGSPYALDTFLPLLPEGIPYGFSYGQMPMAQAIVLEQLVH